VQADDAVRYRNANLGGLFLLDPGWPSPDRFIRVTTADAFCAEAGGLIAGVGATKEDVAMSMITRLVEITSVRLSMRVANG
jgi:hypothetical protein